MKYAYKEMKMNATYIVLNKTFFQNKLPDVHIALIPCKRYADVNVENNILFIDIEDDIEDHQMLGYILFELCQLYAFSAGFSSRTEIAIALASIMDEVGFYVVDDEILVAERFKKDDEYLEIEKDILFTLKDISDCLDI